MTPHIDTLKELMELLGAISTLSGAMASFWRKDGPKEDEIVVEAIDTLIEGLSDSDKIAKIELRTGRNLRNQVSIEKVVEWNDERKLRSWGNRN